MPSLERKLFLRVACGVGFLAAALWAGSLALRGQTQTTDTPQVPAANSGRTRVGVGPDDDPDNPIIHRAAVQAQKKRNEQRQQQIVKDTDKLLELAQQLKAEVAKNDKNTLSATSARKAEEMEKLAKGVKDKMKAE
jgi:hypothetical protein